MIAAVNTERISSEFIDEEKAFWAAYLEEQTKRRDLENDQIDELDREDRRAAGYFKALNPVYREVFDETRGARR